MVTRKEYTDNASPTQLASPINNSTLSFTVAAGTGSGYPTGGTGKFVVQIDEEKILCDSRTADVFTVNGSGRGFGGTSAASHDVVLGAVTHVWDADSANDLMTHVFDTSRDDHTQYVTKALFDTNTVLAATADDTPAALTMAASTILARLAAGGIVAATPAQIRTLLEVVAESLFDANTILKADSDDTPEAMTVAEQTLVGRITGGEIAALTVAQVRTLLDVSNLIGDGTSVQSITGANSGEVQDSIVAAGVALGIWTDDTT